MNLSQVYDLYPLADAAINRIEALRRGQASARSLHAEVNEQIRNQLQTTLDLEHALQIFFELSQAILQFDGLVYTHAQQQIKLHVGKAVQGSAIHYQLEYADEDLGALLLQREAPLREEELISFEFLTTALVFPLRNALKYEAAMKGALRDPLTDVGNRAHMSQVLQRDMDAARRSQQPLSILMLDIDHFKRINDTYGHACGDQVLIKVAQLLKHRLRSIDAIFRYGGEEFLIGLPHTGANQAMLVAERLRLALEQMEVAFAEHRIKLSASLGCAVLLANENLDSFIQRADIALYTAKKHGRNQVKCAR